MFGNWLKTGLLMAGIVALFGAVGLALGGAQGMLLALLIGGGMNVFAYWNSDKIVLRMYNAREVDARSEPRFYRMVEELAQRAYLSRFHFIRHFQQVIHQTPHQYVISRRLQRAKELLANSDLPVTEICLAVGFESLGRAGAGVVDQGIQPPTGGQPR